MRAFYSYGIAAILVIVAALWLGSGNLVRGGYGPGNGEKPIISLIEGKENGPLHNTLDKAGVLAKPVKEENVDPALTIAQRQEEAGTSGAAAARPVSVQTLTAKPMAIEVPLRGQTEAKAAVTTASETTGIVANVSVIKGQQVKSGDLLCTLDQGTRQAALEQANANLAQAQVAYDSNLALVKRGVAAANTTAAAEAGLKAAQAAVDEAKAELARTEIHAKSDGVVQDPANVGSMLAAGQPCATIVQLDPILFTGSVPEAKVGYAKVGLPASVTTVTGQTLTGKVSYVSPVSDPATRTFLAQIELPNPGNAVQAGLTATATINVGTTPAQLLPQSALTLDDDGTMGVRTVEDSKVKFYPVTVVSDAREGMYVTGLPDKVDVITVGQEFVKAGDTVKAVQDTLSTQAKQAEASNGAQQ